MIEDNGSIFELVDSLGCGEEYMVFRAGASGSADGEIMVESGGIYGHFGRRGNVGRVGVVRERKDDAVGVCTLEACKEGSETITEGGGGFGSEF